MTPTTLPALNRLFLAAREAEGPLRDDPDSLAEVLALARRRLIARMASGSATRTPPAHHHVDLGRETW